MKYIKGFFLVAMAMMASVFLFTAAPALASPEPSSMVFLGFGGMIINTTNLSALFTAFQAAFNKGFTGAASDWGRVATVVPSTTKENKYGWLGQFPRLREWLGDRQVKSIAAHDYAVKNKKFESTISVPRDDIDDDTYGVYTPLFESMGDAAKTHPDELVWALLAAGFTTLCYDGQFFFDTDHPVGDSEGAAASVSNMQAGAGAPWFLLQTNRPLKPLIFQPRRDYALKSLVKEDDANVFMRDEYLYGVDARGNVGYGFWQQAFGSKDTLNQANFDLAMTAMMALKSDEGRPLGIKADLLVVGSSNRAAALDTVLTERLANGASNKNYKAVDVLVVPWLA